MACSRYHCWRQDAGLLVNLVEDGCELARMLLALCPGDDGEAVTEEWLRSIGERTSDSEHGRKLYLGAIDFDHTVTSGRVDVCDYTDRVALPIPYRTRGAVRRLCAALGIPLLPRPGGEGG